MSPPVAPYRDQPMTSSLTTLAASLLGFRGRSRVASAALIALLPATAAQGAVQDPGPGRVVGSVVEEMKPLGVARGERFALH